MFVSVFAHLPILVQASDEGLCLGLQASCRSCEHGALPSAHCIILPSVPAATIRVAPYAGMLAMLVARLQAVV